MTSVRTASKAVLDAQLRSRMAMRDSHIDLQGIPCRWYRVAPGQERKDFYGDIPSPTLVREVGNITIMLALSEEDLKFIATFSEPVTGDFRRTVVGAVKFGDDIQIGDRISFDFRHFDPRSTDTKFMEVVYVDGANNQNPIKKTVRLAPVHDLNVSKLP